MNDTFVQVILSAMGTAISAMWVRQGIMQKRIDTLIEKEANCQTRLEEIKKSITEKHAENQQALSALYCKRNPE